MNTAISLPFSYPFNDIVGISIGLNFGEYCSEKHNVLCFSYHSIKFTRSKCIKSYTFASKKMYSLCFEKFDFYLLHIFLLKQIYQTISSSDFRVISFDVDVLEFFINELSFFFHGTVTFA